MEVKLERDKISELQECIYSLVDSAYEDASITQSLWMNEVAKREVKRRQMKINGSEKTHYELRVEFSRYSFIVRWRRIYFTHIKGKPTRMYKAVSQPGPTGYKSSSLKYASEWELELIMGCESQLSMVRKKLRQLGSMHKNLTLYSKEAGVDFTFIPIKDRVQVQQNSIHKFKARYE